MGREIIFDVTTGEVKIVDVPDRVVNIEDLRESMLVSVLDEYKTKIVEGFYTTCTGTPIFFTYSPQDQLNYSKIANLFALNPNKQATYLGSRDNGVLLLTKTQYLKFMEDAEAYEMNMYLKRKELEIRIESAQTIEELNSINTPKELSAVQNRF
jgi:hypothetical protein